MPLRQKLKSCLKIVFHIPNRIFSIMPSIKTIKISNKILAVIQSSYQIILVIYFNGRT